MEMVCSLSLPMVLIIKNEDTNPEAKDSGIDTDYSSDIESITSSAYTHRFGKRRFKISAVL